METPAILLTVPLVVFLLPGRLGFVPDLAVSNTCSFPKGGPFPCQSTPHTWQQSC